MGIVVGGTGYWVSTGQGIRSSAVVGEASEKGVEAKHQNAARTLKVEELKQSDGALAPSSTRKRNVHLKAGLAGPMGCRSESGSRGWTG